MKSKSYRTNLNFTVSGGDIETSIAKAVETVIAIAEETAGVKLKVHSSKTFPVARHRHTGVQLILTPDLPQWVACRLSGTPPTIDTSFMLMTDDGEAPETYIEIKNPKAGGLDFIYGTEWPEASTAHAYFLAGCKALKDRTDPKQSAIVNTQIKGLTFTGVLSQMGAIAGNIQLTGTKLEAKELY